MSFKERIAKRLCLLLRKIPILNNTLFTLSKIYIDEYRYFSYDPDVNGEKKIIKKLSQTITGKPIIFDVGANVGDWTDYADSLFEDYKAHLFELSKATCQTLEDRFSGNKKTVINNLALSDKNGQIEYVDYGKNDGGNTLLLNANYHKKKSSVAHARAIKGDDYCAERNIDRINYLKIDTEGAEYLVLKGFEELLQNHAIDIVQFEYGYTHADAKTLMKDFFEFFESNEYIVGRLSKKGVQFKTFSYADNDFKSGPNYIACLPKFKDTLQKF